LPCFLREVYTRRRITIVNYHDPQPEVFERHIHLFSKIYSFIDINSLTNALKTKDFSNLPPKPLLITFDDSYKGNAKLFRIIQKYRVPVVIYAVAGIVNTNRHFWFNAVPSIHTELPKLLKVSDKQRRRRLNVHFSHYDNKEYKTRQALSLHEIREFLTINGTVGSHTIFHPILNKCSDRVGFKECINSKKIIEALTGKPVLHFAYPGGSKDERTFKWLKFAGYRTARTIEPGWVTTATDPLALPNFPISDDAGINKAIVQTSGLWGIMKKSLGLTP